MRRGSLVMACVAIAALAGAIAFHEAEGYLSAPRVVQATHDAADLGPKPEPQAEGELVTHLPILSVDTAGAPIPQAGHDGTIADEYPAGTAIEPSCKVDVIDAEGAWHRESDEPDQEVAGTIRVRGNSSRNFDKKSYLLRIGDNAGPDERTSLLGMPKASEWVLHGPFLDRTLMRNSLCYAVAREIMPYAPRARYCEVILNGEYQGVYLLTEAITKGEGRVEISEPTRNSMITGWLVRWDREGKGDELLDSFTYYTYRSGVSQLDLRYPGKNTATDERIRYVTAQIGDIERELYATGTSDDIDISAFAQYFLLNELFGNVDAGRFSTFLYKDVRGKVTPVVWDFNNAFDNYIESEYDETGFYLTDAPWFDALLTDERFVESVVSQYRALRATALSDEALCSYLDDTMEYLGEAADRNNERWDVYDLSTARKSSKDYDVQYLHPLERNFTSYSQSVEQLKDWIAARGAWLDEHIDSLRQHCHPSKGV